MAQQIINIGAAANDRTGDTWRTGGDKINDNFTELFDLVASGSRVIVSELSDFPAPAAGIITLLASTQYFLTADISLGTNRIVWADSAAISSIESTIISLTYTGTGDMFTFSDTTARINNITLDAPNGRLFNWTDTTTKIGRFNDVTVLSCDKIGRFNGTSGILRFTNFSPATVTTDGLEFLGNFRNLLWEVSAFTISAGAIFNLGTATFDSFIADTILATLNGTSNLVSGAASSANINTGGSGLIKVMRLSGAGTPLSGLTVDDALWEFKQNDDIADTRPDGLLSMQSNATNTVIAAAGTPVLVAGTWVVERGSQFTGTTGGRLTYNGGKDTTVPITASLTVEPASGGAVDISVEVAVNGSVIANSKRTANASSGNPTSITVPWQEVLSPTNFVEVFVSNEATTVDILASSAILRIN
jgi:hypothetical protein